MAEDVEDLLEPAGFEREARPYVPHLTLGRARGRQAKLEVASVSPPALRFKVSGVELVESAAREGRSHLLRYSKRISSDTCGIC